MVQKIEINTKTFIRFWLVSLAFCLLALFIWRAVPAIIIVALSIFLAIAIKPLAKRIDNIDKNKKRTSLTAVLAVFIVLGIISTIIAIIGPVVINETSRFVNQIPTTVEKTLHNQQEINRIGRTFGINNLQAQISQSVNNFSNNILSNLGDTVIASVGTAASILTSIILVFVLTILFLLQGPKLLDMIWKYLTAYQGQSTASAWQRITGRMADVIAKYVTGQVIVAVLDGVVVAFTLFILSLIFNFSAGLAFPFGLISFIFYLIPMFGPVISCALNSILLALSNPLAGLIFLIVYAVYSQIENNLIAPKIQGNAMRLPSLVILVAITFGMYMFGLIGAIIAIPIAGCIKVIIEEYPAIRKL